MKLHNYRPLEGEPPLAPPDWEMTVDVNESGYYFAEVMRAGTSVVRVSLNTRFESREEAEVALAKRVRAWIADYLQRPASQ